LDPQDFLYFAEELAGKTPSKPYNDEAKYRSIISRAYYAAFLMARDYCEYHTNLVIQHDGTDHTRVRDKFKYNRTDGKWVKIGVGLGILLENRTFADYNDPIPHLPNLAELMLSRAKYVIQLLENLPGN
jgi:hypothetical protein